MKKSVISIIVLIYFTGCQYNDPVIEQFQNHIGETNNGILQEIMEDFENGMQNQTNENTYKFLISKTVSGKLSRKDWFESSDFLSDIRKDIIKSGFVNDFHISPSSVDFESGILIKKYV